MIGFVCAGDLFYENGLRFSCKRGCVACCAGEPGYVFLSDNDIENICEATGLNLMQVRQAYVRDFVSEKGIHHDVLREYSNAKCVFLGESGCMIYQHRPMQCRTYPFWSRIVESLEKWESEGAMCPGINAGKVVVSKDEIEVQKNLFKFPEDLC